MRICGIDRWREETGGLGEVRQRRRGMRDGILHGLGRFGSSTVVAEVHGNGGSFDGKEVLRVVTVWAVHKGAAAVVGGLVNSTTAILDSWLSELDRRGAAAAGLVATRRAAVGIKGGGAVAW